MNNLTQTQSEAKQAFLNRQQDEMLALYEKAGKSERNAVIKQIDNFLSVVSREEKFFWLKFRRKLEVLSEPKILFPLGQVVMTIGAREAFDESNQIPFEYLAKHQTGDWGEVCEDDRQENDLSVKCGYRILSAYKTVKGEKIWIITEADRSSTTILLPDEY